MIAIAPAMMNGKTTTTITTTMTTMMPLKLMVMLPLQPLIVLPKDGQELEWSTDSQPEELAEPAQAEAAQDAVEELADPAQEEGALDAVEELADPAPAEAAPDAVEELADHHHQPPEVWLELLASLPEVILQEENQPAQQ